jgi:hypothetical protein
MSDVLSRMLPVEEARAAISSASRPASCTLNCSVTHTPPTSQEHRRIAWRPHHTEETPRMSDRAIEAEGKVQQGLKGGVA